MARLFIAPVAQRDLESILTWTQDHFGEDARLRYEALVIQAIRDLGEDPDRPGSAARPEIAAAARTYHLWHSRSRVPAESGRVKNPRHFILYRMLLDGSIEIGRILHESMELNRHLPEDYRD